MGRTDDHRQAHRQTANALVVASQAKRTQVSRSLIVELSLWAALEELQDKGEKSQLASKLVSQ